MTASCQLCGKLIEGKFIPAPGDPMGQLQAYDSLSAHMWAHISDDHRPQMEEGMLVQRRAAKMYAMNWADHTEEMIGVKQEWRQHMLIAMSVTTRAEGDVPPDDQAAAGGAAGSNEKNEARKRSN
jgi:hypothetical protein